MSITLHPKQMAWLESHVASGGFSSIEEAALHLIDERIAELEALEEDDFAWAKPYVEEAEAQIANGKFISLEEHEARVAAYLALAL